MRGLIAGASGAIGRALVRRLRANQHEVFALTQSRDSGAGLKEIGAELWHRLLRPPGGDGVRVWRLRQGAGGPSGRRHGLSVGMYLQTLLLALTERGLGTCVEVSVAGYPEIVRAKLAIPAELSILCGLAVGYPDPDFAANKLHVGREAIEKNVMFLDS
jgi:nitroreductase